MKRGKNIPPFITAVSPIVILFSVLLSFTNPVCGADFPFDDLPDGYFFTQPYDLNNDGIYDIIFQTHCGLGFKASARGAVSLQGIVHPGLQGQICSGSDTQPEVVIDFPRGACDTMSFHFAVQSPLDSPDASDHPEAYIQIRGQDTSRLPIAVQAEGIPAEASLEMEIPFTATTIYIDFYSGTGSSFIMDDFTIETVYFEPHCQASSCLQDTNCDGDVDGLDLAYGATCFPQSFPVTSFATNFGETDCHP